MIGLLNLSYSISENTSNNKTCKAYNYSHQICEQICKIMRYSDWIKFLVVKIYVRRCKRFSGKCLIFSTFIYVTLNYEAYVWRFQIDLL